jgi:plasmid stabilization system protein ParE
LSWKVTLSADALADIRGITEWLCQSGAGVRARQKLDALKRGLRGLRNDPLRHPIFGLAGKRKCSTRGGYEIHYQVVTVPPGSTVSGFVEVLFVKSPLQDYTTFEG